MRGGLARLIKLIGKVASPFSGLTARLLSGGGADLPAQLRKGQLYLYRLQILDRIGIQNEPCGSAVFDRVGGSGRNDDSNHRQFLLANSPLRSNTARGMNNRQVGLMGDGVEDRVRDRAVVLVENRHRIFATRRPLTAINFRQRKTGRCDDGDRRDQQHEQADPIAPDEQEFLADRQPDREQHHRLVKGRSAVVERIAFMAYREGRDR